MVCFIYLTWLTPDNLFSIGTVLILIQFARFLERDWTRDRFVLSVILVDIPVSGPGWGCTSPLSIIAKVVMLNVAAEFE